MKLTKLTKNIGHGNRLVRFVAGLVLLIISIINFSSHPVWIVGIAIGVLLIFEGVYGWCIWHEIRETQDLR